MSIKTSHLKWRTSNEPQMKLNISTFNAKGKLATEVASKTHMF